jgi:hypothetical protein
LLTPDSQALEFLYAPPDRQRGAHQDAQSAQDQEGDNANIRAAA